MSRLKPKKSKLIARPNLLVAGLIAMIVSLILYDVVSESLLIPCTFLSVAAFVMVIISLIPSKK